MQASVTVYRQLWSSLSGILVLQKRKHLPDLRGPWVALISVSLALSQTPVYTARLRIRG